MESVLKSDIFFFITSAVVIVMGISGIFLMFQIYRLLQEIREIARHTRQGAEWLLEDFDEMRGAVREKGLRLRFFIDFFRGLFGPRFEAHRRARKERAESASDASD